MALQTSGPISLGDIRSVLGTSSNNFSLHGAEFGTYGAINQNSTFKPNGLNPNSISEWYGYDHGGGGNPSDWGTCYALTSTSFKGAKFRYWICDEFGGCGITQSITVIPLEFYEVCSSQLPVVISGSGDVSLSDGLCCNTIITTTTTVTYTGVSLYYDTTILCPTTNLSTKYINGPTFNSSSTTKIYTNTSGTLAPAGYYQDLFGISRFWDGTNLGLPIGQCLQ